MNLTRPAMHVRAAHRHPVREGQGSSMLRNDPGTTGRGRRSAHQSGRALSPLLWGLQSVRTPARAPARRPAVVGRAPGGHSTAARVEAGALRSTPGCPFACRYSSEGGVLSEVQGGRRQRPRSGGWTDSRQLLRIRLKTIKLILSSN